MNKSRLSTALFCILFMTVLAPVKLGSAVERQQAYQFFFYHPDSVQNNLSFLKARMDIFFAETGISVQFQPFAHLADFDNSLRTQKPAFQWVPQWYVDIYGEKLGIKPFLIAVRGGKSTYRKVLLGSKQNKGAVADLSGRTLAMTAMGPDREKILDRILFAPNHMDGKRLSIVEVPKDSDALLALILGQVDLALVSEDNLHELGRLSAVVEKNVVEIQKTTPISMPFLCYLEGSVAGDEVLRMKEVFLEPVRSADGQGFKEALQIDAWQPVSH